METAGPSLKIYKSSAGSGKTYQLVLNYLSLILKSPNPDKFKRILAITFTNKAAQEMKERVIDGLKKLKSGEDSRFIEDYVKETGIPAHELSVKAETLLTHILHNYGHLNILTIDKFVHRIIRSFSRELGLTTNFELTFDFDDITSRCIDQVLQEVGNDDNLTKILIEYYRQLIDQEDDPNIDRALQDSTKILQKEDAIKKLDFYSNKDLSYFVKVRKETRAKIRTEREKMIALADEAKSILGDRLYDLKKGTSKYYPFLEGLDNFSAPPNFLTDSQVKNIQQGIWVAKKTEKDIPELANILSSRGERLKEIFLSIHKMAKQEFFLKSLDKNLMSFALLNDVQQHISQFKTDNNIVLIEELNRIITDIIGKESAPYIYEKIGARFENYFIDEFQDTSQLQWQNLIPLIHDSLSSGHENLIVGDAKQSIYRWRGGNAQQFIDLPRIDVEVANLRDVNQSFLHSHEGYVLKDNYRSSNSVIAFNNWLFPNLISELGSNVMNGIYADITQNTKKEATGFVDVTIIHKEQEKEGDPSEENLLQQISDCLEDGYAYKDICILTRTNNQGIKISEFLVNQKLPVTSQESLLLKESPEAKLIYAFLKVLYRQTEENVMRLFSYYGKKDLIELFERYRIPQDDNSFYHSGYDLKAFLSNELPSFDLEQFNQLSSYDQTNYLLEVLDISRKNIYVDKLMNAVFDFQQNNGHQTQRLIEFFEEKIMNSSIVPPESSDAITVMTIHKSKGLQFPVVLIPMKIDRLNKPESLWLSGELITELGLSEVNMVATKEGTTEEIQGAKDEHEELSAIDLLNMIYVAYTRAEDRLYIQYFENRAGEVVKKQIKLIENHPNYSSEKSKLIIGKREKSKLKKVEKTKYYSLSNRTTSNWRDVLILATPETSINQEAQTYSDRNWGLALHEILQKIDRLSMSDHVVEQFIHKNKEWEIHQEKIRSIIEQFVQNKAVKSIYSDAVNIFSERSLGTSFNSILRPDKVIEKENEVIVVDFKTGEAQAKHKQQILAYGHLLQEMYQKQIKMYLIYLSADKITILNV